jgi:RHS repeat-associated protein
LASDFLGITRLEAQGAQTTAVYTYGNALVRKDGEYPLFDGLGSERTVTNSSQTVIGTISYDAFGQTVGTTGTSTNPYMFAATWGYRTDGDAGLMHVGARYYDAQVGRFITRDTVLSEHPYLYCEHEPVNSVDPSGHQSIYIGGGAMVVVSPLGGWIDGGILFNPITGDTGIGLNLVNGIGYGIGIDGGLVSGLGTGGVNTGITPIGGYGAFVNVGWGAGATVTFGGGNVSVSGGPAGPGVGGGIIGGIGLNLTIQLGNLYKAGARIFRAIIDVFDLVYH